MININTIQTTSNQNNYLIFSKKSNYKYFQTNNEGITEIEDENERKFILKDISNLIPQVKERERSR